MLFDITWEAAGFTKNRAIIDTEISQAEARETTEDLAQQKKLPENIRAIRGAYITEDDGQSGSNRRVFLCVRFCARFDSERRAFSSEPPIDALEKISEMLGGDSLSLEGDWQVASVDQVETYVDRDAPRG